MRSLVPSRSLPRRLTALALAALFPALVAAPPALATCGGGGGGGLGGIPVGAGGEGETYQVPWVLVRPGDAAPSSAMVVFWFPTSAGSARASSLQTSRNLTLWAARCVAPVIITPDHQALHSSLAVPSGVEAVVVADADGKEMGRLAAGERPVAAREVEKLVRTAMDTRQQEADRRIEEAEGKTKQGDADAAAALYGEVWKERCLLPSAGKKAAKGLRKLGRPVPEEEVSALGAGEPATGEAAESRISTAMQDGLAAERSGDYQRARERYLEARRLDPADPVPLRFLGELYRHHTGEWPAARVAFQRILAMPADPLSRAVALHGLGKMTIHDGDFAAGLALFERSIATYPLALTYRNLAVYWNSAGETAKAKGYVDQALALDPDDPYNRVFAATFLAEEGQREEALAVAHANEDLLAASYNLAAIYALSGQQERALDLLHRHFYDYERYDAVRAREMKEAREDVVFASLHADPRFVRLTALAMPSSHPMPGAPGGSSGGGSRR